MDDTALKKIQEADWADISARVLSFVRGRMWANGMQILPGGHTPEDVVNVAIEKVLSGERRWDPVRHKDLRVHLEWIAKSLISDKGLAGAKDKSTVSFTDLNDTPDPEAPREDDCPLGDEMALRMEELHKDVDGNQELRDIVAAIELGCDKSGEIAEQTGIKEERVYELRRKLSRHAEKAVARAKARLKGGVQ